MKPLTSLLALLAAAPLHAATRYVDADANGADNGTSWSDAYPDLQSALSAASNGDQIWVAEGTYYPDIEGGANNDSRSATFTLINGVAIYGGFAGSETLLTERNPDTHATILSGNVDNDGTVTNNAYHVVTVTGTNSTAVLDGFTITGGNANAAAPNERGGGLVGQTSSSCTLANLKFEYNHAAIGGAAYFNNGSPQIIGCLFLGNTSSGAGGGLYLNQTSATVRNSRFLANSAATFGGGAYLRGPDNVINTAFVGNVAGTDGSAVYAFTGTTPTLINCTVTQNDITDNTGAAVFFSPGTLNLKNSVLWDNAEDEISPDPGAPSANNLVQDATVSGHVISNSDPVFFALPTPGDEDWTTLGNNNYGDLHALADATRNTGDNSLNATSTDLAGKPRIRGAAIDLGVYESQIIHVDADQIYQGTGASWATAFRYLQVGLSAAGPGDEIRVAEGTYLPVYGVNRGSTFSIGNGLRLFGGWAGTEVEVSAPEDRTPMKHPCILSGEIDNDNTLDNNSYHVITVPPGSDFNTHIDGFIIQEGNAIGAPYPYGGGLLGQNADPRISNCIFRGNRASQGGGVAFFDQSSPAIYNCAVHGNYADDHGGGIAFRTPGLNQSFPDMVNCTIQGNRSFNPGGGIYILNANAAAVNSIIWDNESALSGFENVDKSYYSDGGSLVGAPNAIEWLVGSSPDFAQPANPADAPTTTPVNLRLQSGSPYLNAGSNGADLDGSGPGTILISQIPKDLAGNPRVVGPSIDLGAYEIQGKSEIEIRYAGQTLPSDGPVVDLGLHLLDAPPSQVNLTFANHGDIALNWNNFVFSGTDGASVASIQNATGGSAPPFGETNKTMLLPTTQEGTLEASASITNNDVDASPYLIHFTWEVIDGAIDSDQDGLNDFTERTDGNSFTDVSNPDTDNDGIKDGGEVQLASLGFVNGEDDSGLVTLLHDNGPSLGLYTASSIEAMAVTQPVISRDPGTGKFTIHTELLRSPDLVTPWATFPDFLVTKQPGTGEMLLEFDPPTPDTHFFQISVGE